MPVINAVSTTLPQYIYNREDIHAVSAQWLKDSPKQHNLFDRFVDNSQISSRHFAIPLETILSLKGAGDRSAYFQEHGNKLLRQAVNELLSKTETPAHSYDHLIFTSCSSPTIPAIDVSLIDDLAFPRHINRIPIYQHGCAGGIIGLALANRLIRPGQRGLLASVEICSLVYQGEDLSGGNLVGSAIFGDGAAAVLIEGDCENGLKFIDTRSHLIPHSAHLMGYTIKDDGNHLRLDRALPQALTLHAPPFLRRFLGEQDKTPQDISYWLFHPGGVKVLQALEHAFAIKRTQSRWAWEILEKYGNMSSASILFVLEAFLQENIAQQGELICMLGVGPGLTVEAILLEQK